MKLNEDEFRNGCVHTCRWFGLIFGRLSLATAKNDETCCSKFWCKKKTNPFLLKDSIWLHNWIGLKAESVAKWVHERGACGFAFFAVIQTHCFRLFVFDWKFNLMLDKVDCPAIQPSHRSTCTLEQNIKLLWLVYKTEFQPIYFCTRIRYE